MKEDEVLEYLNQLESVDESLSEFSKKYSELAAFLADYDFLKDKNHLSQKEVAKRMGTTQSAISRIECFKTNPSYLQLKKMAEAVGGKFYISPIADYVYSIPVDLQEQVKEIADKKHEAVVKYLDNCIREVIQSDYDKLDVELDKNLFYLDTSKTCEPDFSETVTALSDGECNNDYLAA